ncbi:MAG: DUF4271 domain-containing protein [Bacteroidales bacterium]|nr:DUF4271 domain-containing protein [Bacteroidales bacterium]
MNFNLIENPQNLPQAQDTTISTILRVDSSDFNYQFITEDVDSSGIVSNDSLLKPPDSTVIIDSNINYNNKPTLQVDKKSDTSSIKTVTYKQKDIQKKITTEKDTIFKLEPQSLLFANKQGKQNFNDCFFFKTDTVTKKKEKHIIKEKHSENKVNIKETKEHISYLPKIKIIERDTGSEFGSIKYSTDWIIYSIILIFVLISWVRIFNSKYFKNIIKSTYNYQISKRLFDEKNAVSQRTSFILNIVYILGVSLFSFLAFNYFNFKLLDFSDFETFMIFIVFFITIYVIKLIFLKILGFVLLSTKEFSEYIHNVFIFNKFFGFFLIFLIIAIPFINENVRYFLILSGIISFIIIYFFRVIRGLLICIKINLSIFYLILYLCTLEIFPMLILYKIFILLM